MAASGEAFGSAVSAEPEAKPRRVEFCTSLRVVLIPSRGEYKRAGLYGDLWWASGDFMQFQASANSEIRMLASYEGIGAKAARQKLYQPGNESLDPDEFLAFVGRDAASDVASDSSVSSLSPYSSSQDLAKRAQVEAVPAPPTTAISSKPIIPISPVVCPSSNSIITSAAAASSAAAATSANGSATAITSTSPSLILATPASTTSPQPSQPTSLPLPPPQAPLAAEPTPHLASTLQGPQPPSSIPRPLPPVVGLGAAGVGTRQPRRAADNSEDDTFGHFDVKDDGNGNDGGGMPQEKVAPPINDGAAELERRLSSESQTGSSSLAGLRGLRARSHSASSASSGGSGTEDEDEDLAPRLARVSSLDCVKSALRVPVPDGESEEGGGAGGGGDWMFDGRLKRSSSSNSSGTLHRRSVGGEGGDNSNSSSNSSKRDGPSKHRSLQSLPAVVDNFWTLVVAMDKPNGLDGVRKSRFSRYSANNGEETGISFLSLALWIGTFFVIIYLVLDKSGTVTAPPSPIPH